ncbi:MAG TPA: SLC13 family permease [Acidobacteriota bacterium]|nr:SLC13 family permease [Acidobacteriota bacterium]
MLSIIFVLALLVLAIFLFSTELLSFDVVAILLLTALLVSRIVSPEEAFRGFGSDTVIIIGGLFVLSAALLRTGLMERIGAFLQKHAGDNQKYLAALIMITVALVSAFISNTAATAFFLPAVVALARRAKISPSKLLMPLAFASILTSSVTLISTSTNIVVSGLLSNYKMEPMGMFELAPVGIPISIAGFIYMFTIGMKMVPDRDEKKTLAEAYNLRGYLTEVIVLPGSSLIGKTVEKVGPELNLTIVGLVKEDGRISVPHPKDVIKDADVLLVEGSAEEILKIKDAANLEIKADFTLPPGAFQTEELSLIEAIIMPGSRLRGLTLKQARFRQRYGLSVLAINRQGFTLRSKLSEIPLRIGDVLLIEGSKNRIQEVIEEGDLSFLGELSEVRARSAKAGWALLIFSLTIALGTFKILPFSSAILLGTLLMFLTKTITPQEAYNAMEWRILILIGSMIAFGLAMENSGAAKFVSAQMVNLLGHYGPMAILAGFFVLTVILTQPMSNQAAALVLIPVAIQAANHLNLNPRTFAMMIAVAASCSYLTPLEPSCVLVYGPGKYKFTDFLKVGSLLTIIIFAIAMLLVPYFWPLYE